MSVAIRISEYLSETVRIACDKYGRAGAYSRERFEAMYGHDAGPPDLLREIADCPRWSGASDPCGAHYPDLAAWITPPI